MGRPKKENSKDDQIRMRLTKDEHERLKKVSNSQGLTVAEFIRSCVNLYMLNISQNNVFDKED